MSNTTRTSESAEIRVLEPGELDGVAGANSLIFGGWVAGWFYVGYKIRTWLF
ncbi:MAG: hypothetical protein AB7O57_18995 [Hyphomicrobiaceae bacterium]